MRTACALVILGFSPSLVACGGSAPASPPESATPTASSSRETPLSPMTQAQAHSNLLYIIDSADGSTDGNIDKRHSPSILQNRLNHSCCALRAICARTAPRVG